MRTSPKDYPYTIPADPFAPAAPARMALQKPEAKAAAALAHPNIVAIQDQGWNEGGVPAVFIVMEYIEGFTLRDVIAEQGALGVTESLRYFAPVISAMSAAHKAGILHRDIKPENILISKDGRVKIADFGLAKGAQLGSTLTVESSVILGSVSYLSPEQVQRGLSDMRSDVYSLGIVLFEVLTGQKPYQGEDPVQIAIRHVNERVPEELHTPFQPIRFPFDAPTRLRVISVGDTCDDKGIHRTNTLDGVADVEVMNTAHVHHNDALRRRLARHHQPVTLSVGGSVVVKQVGHCLPSLHRHNLHLFQSMNAHAITSSSIINRWSSNSPSNSARFHMNHVNA